MPVVVTLREPPTRQTHPAYERVVYSNDRPLPFWLRTHVDEMFLAGQLVRDTGVFVIQLQRESGGPPPPTSFVVAPHQI